MAQYKVETGTLDPKISSHYEVVMLANNANGELISRSNPLPVSLGADTITITGNTFIVDTVNVASSPENPVHNHITEVGTSGLLNVAFMPIGGNVNVNNIITITGNVTTNGTVNIGNFPPTQTVNGTIELGDATLDALEIIFQTLNNGNTMNLTSLSVSVLAANGSGNLSYANTTGVFTFTPAEFILSNSVHGPIQGLKFDTTHIHTTKDAGTLCWNDADRTLNIQHPNDVVQQVGQETYILVKNNTGSTIPNATSVRFSGSVGVDGEARITVAPFLADGTYPSLYTIGIATEPIANGAEGFITVFGKVREIDTTGSSVSETWVLGDILYAHPTIAGSLTRVKPTAPYNVVPMAAVVTVDATEGEIFVRPTIEQKYSYGRFSRTTDFTFAATNTAYAITLDTTQISNGVTRGSPTSHMVVDQSGYYQVDATVQLDTTSNKGICYLWLRKNGTNVVGSTRREAIETADDVRNFSYIMEISLNAGDYIELCTAATSTDLRMDAAAATAFAPTTAGVLISVNQIVL